ncbi:hypothetical protein KKH23_06605, partial [Patescibacteria group bacterium]|nr:hypothetical protein [Patescibacteria group bacterium]
VCGVPCRSMKCPECGVNLVAAGEEEEPEPEAEEASQDEALKAKRARSQKYGIALVEGKPVTKPGEYASIPDSEFGDPVNYAYPADEAHARAALGYFNHANARSAGGYSEADWGTIGKRLAKLVSRHLDADYEYKDGELQQKESKESGTQEGYGELQDFVGRVWAALGARFCPGEMSSGVWITDAPGDDPVWDNAVVAEIDGARWSIGYRETAAGFTFADRSDWQEVTMTYSGTDTGKTERPQNEEVNEDMDEKEQETAEEEQEEAELCESIAGTVSLGEAQAAVGDPLTMRVQLIKPGWGNQKDNHFYPAEMLKRDARVFVGAKMFETDHKPSETNNRTWVSTITDILGFSDAGAPVAEVVVHSPDFAQRARNLAAAELLEKLECSIRATGRTKPHQEGERKGYAVEAITSAKSVDWVTKAGAGGKAINIMEGEQEPEPEPKPEPTYLAKETVAELLEASKMPKAAQAKLVEGNYLDEEAVKAAVKAERAYLQEITGAGKPIGMGKSEPPKVDLEEIERKKDNVNAKYLGTRRAER